MLSLLTLLSVADAQPPITHKCATLEQLRLARTAIPCPATTLSFVGALGFLNRKHSPYWILLSILGMSKSINWATISLPQLKHIFSIYTLETLVVIHLGDMVPLDILRETIKDIQ